jgi:hypothetical protein
VFDEAVTITMECHSELRPTPDRQAIVAPPEALSRLLGSKIARVVRSGKGDIQIDFTNSSTLVVKDSNTDYESYQIRSRSNTIIV